jgi:hypothetical protein
MSPIFAVCLCKTKKKLTFPKKNYFVAKLQKFWIVFFILLSQTLLAQYTNIINSNRPGFSESPYSVGTRVYQLETSLFYRNTDIHPTFSRPQSYGVDFLFRTSFFKEKLELNLNLAYQNEQISFQNIFNSSYYKNGIGKFTVAAKYLIYEQKYTDKSKEIRSWVERNRFDFKRLIPTVAAYVGINTGVPDDVFVTKDFSPKAGVLLQNDLSDNFNIITNLYYDRIGTELPEFSYIVTATYSFSPRWSIFIENQTLFDKYKYQSNIGSGIAFLYNRNIQINSSVRLLADSSTSGFYSSVGVSYRFDRHVDKITKLDENGNPLKNDKGLDVKKRKFFNRLFGKVRNIFSKKSKRQASRSKKLNKETKQSIRNNTSNNINKKSDELSDPPLRVKPKRTRVKPSNIKGKKDKSKKGILNIFKRNSDENETPIKDEDKGTKELEKEIKKLEREVKKDKAKSSKKEKKESKRLKKEKEKKEKKKKNKEDKNLTII